MKNLRPAGFAANLVCGARKNPMFGKPRPEGSGHPGQKIEVLDVETDSTITYDSIAEAARALNIKHSTIVNYFARNQKNLTKESIYFT